MSYVSKITDTSGNTGLIGSSLYGTCPTGASTAAKVAVIEGFDTLIEGVTVHIKFTYSNTATTPTLSIKSSASATSGTTAKNIYKYGTTKPGTTAATSWQAGSVVSFTYDGSYWQMNDHLDDTNTQTVSSVNSKTGAVTLTASDVGALASSTTYAGASTAGGSATSAAKLDTATAGSATQPCYFSSGVPSACTYELNKTVPSDAVFTDTNDAVTQTATSTDADYEILFSGTADNTTRTEGTRKDSRLQYNPSTKQISITKASETSGGSSISNIYTYATPRHIETSYCSGASGSQNYTIYTSRSAADSMLVRTQYHTSSGTTDAYKIKTEATNIVGSYGSTNKFQLQVPSSSGSSYSGSLLLTNGQSSPTSLTANNTDITLAGASNTWDGTNTSLKSAVTGAKGSVTQTILSADNDNDYHFVLSKSANVNTETDSVNKAQSLTYNEKSGEIAGAKSFRVATTDYNVLLQPGELFISDLGNSTSVDVTAADIVLSGTGNTWDGNHTSLKGALTPVVVSNSTVNLNNYTSSGKFILTGGISTKTNFPITQPGYLEVTTWSESSTNWYCRQDFKRYDTSINQNDTFTRIATSTNGGTSWSWSAWCSDSYFLPGETYTITNGTIVASYVTSSSTELTLGIWLPKSMKYTNGLSSKPSTVNLIVRGGNGQYLQASNSGYAFKWNDSFRIQPSHLQVKLKKSDGTAFSNCVNNDPYATYFNGDATITFS